jgi:predicted dehydrogenase
VRVAIVGTGGVAQRHLGVLGQLPELEIVGHVSLDPDRAAAQAAQWGGAGFGTVDDVIKTCQPEAVWICVTPDRHGPLELALIDANVPFFVEKPLSVDLATAEMIAQRLDGSRLVVAVGYKFRALDTLPRVRELLAQSPLRMVLAQWHDSLPPPKWWHHAKRSGGQIVEQATHLLDLARVLVGEADVISASGGRWPRPDAPDSDVPDVSAAFLRFATPQGSVPGVLTATSLLRGQKSIQLQLVCEGRALTISERALLIDTEQILTAVDPFLVEDIAFITAVRSNDPTKVLCTYADALETHRLATKIRDAMEQ